MTKTEMIENIIGTHGFVDINETKEEIQIDACLSFNELIVIAGIIEDIINGNCEK